MPTALPSNAIGGLSYVRRRRRFRRKGRCGRGTADERGNPLQIDRFGDVEQVERDHLARSNRRHLDSRKLTPPSAQHTMQRAAQNGDLPLQNVYWRDRLEETHAPALREPTFVQRAHRSASGLM